MARLQSAQVMIGLALLLVSPAEAREPLVQTAEFKAARKLILTSYFAQGVKAYLEIADKNPGTRLGAAALGEAFLSTSGVEQRKAILQRIVREYPGTADEIVARIDLIGFSFSSYQDPGGNLGAVEQLAKSLGGPSIAEILSRVDLLRLSQKIWGLGDEIQYGLVSAYIQLREDLRHLERFQDALTLAIFVRQTFARVDELGQLQRDVEMAWLRANSRSLNSLYSLDRPTVDPKLRVKGRRRGLCGVRPRFSFEASTGPLPYHQINLATSKFLLDGQDLSSNLEVSSHIDARAAEGSKRPFETLRISLRVPRPLAPGIHTLVVEIRSDGYKPGGPGLTRYEHAFRCHPIEDDDEDDRDEQSRWDQDW